MFGQIEPAKVNGLYEAMMGGARPRVGTPPFSAPFPQTGGANAPTTPGTLPVKHGLSGFIERLLNPSNSLGQFGQALLASSGGPLGNAIGFMLQQRAAAGQRDAKFEDWKRTYDYEAQHPKPSTAQPYRWERNDGSVMQIDPETGEAKVLYADPNPKNFTMQAIDNGDGTKTLVPVPLGGAAAGGAQPPATLPPDFDFGAGGAGGNARGGFPVNADLASFKRAIIGQESGGRYGVANAEGSGAMGVGQVMPATARVLAGRLGLPYRPDLLGGRSETAKRYQDAITDAAAREAWDAGNGNPEAAAMYYHGGSDRRVWGPKTRRYASEVLRRMGAR